MLIKRTTIFHKIFFASIIAFQLLHVACNNANNNILSADDFDRFIKQANAQYGAGAKAFVTIDSVFRSHPHASKEVRFKFYNYACGYYHTTKVIEDSAMLYADSMLGITNNRSDKSSLLKEEAIANISKGDILLAKKNYQQAYRYFYLGKLAAQKSTDPCTYSEYSYRLGMVSYRQGDFSRAANYFKQSFTQSLNCDADYPHAIRQQEVLNNIALSYYNQKRLDSADIYYNKTIEFINSKESLLALDTTFIQTAKAVAHATKALIEAERNIPAAKLYFEKSITTNLQPRHDAGYALNMLVAYANMYVKAKQWQDAFEVLQRVRQVLDTLHNNDAALAYNKMMYQYYDGKQDATAAYSYLKAYEQLQSITSSQDDIINKIAVTDEIEDLQRQYELSLLKSDQHINTLYLISLSSVLILLAVILFFIRNGARKAKKNLLTQEHLNAQVQEQKLAVERANEKLELRNKEKDAILRVVAHDLRNPISGVYASLDIMKEVYDVSDDQKEYIHLMQTACSDALELINSLLDVTSDTKGKSVPKKPVDLAAIIRHCVHLLQFRAGEKHQVIEMNIGNQPAIVDANEEKLRRVVNNLLTNAIKFSNNGAAIQVALRITNNEVEAWVKDDGIGIPPEMQPAIFDVFTKAKRYGTKNEKPYGLGLSICKQIIEDHHGRIWFESKQGKGTCFHIALPQSKAAAVQV